MLTTCEIVGFNFYYQRLLVKKNMPAIDHLSIAGMFLIMPALIMPATFNSSTYYYTYYFIVIK